MSDPVSLALIALAATVVTLIGQIVTAGKASEAKKAATAAAAAATAAALKSAAAADAASVAALASERNTEMLKYLQELVAGQKSIAATEAVDAAWKLNAEDQNRRSIEDRADLNLEVGKLATEAAAARLGAAKRLEQIRGTG